MTTVLLGSERCQVIPNRSLCAVATSPRALWIPGVVSLWSPGSSRRGRIALGHSLQRATVSVWSMRAATRSATQMCQSECWFRWRWPCARSTCTSTQSGSVARDSEKALIQARLARGSWFHLIVATDADQQPADQLTVTPAAKGGRKRCSYVSVRSLPGVEPERCGPESVRLT